MLPTSRNSDDESDHESISELLSPTDGYFAEGRSHPGELLVPDPSQGTSRLDKEREAAEELRASEHTSSNAAPSRIETSATASRQSRSSDISPVRRDPIRFAENANENTPLIPSAPPAYSPPEPGSPYHREARTMNSTGMYETMGRSERFFPNSTQDLGGESESLLDRGGDDDKKKWSNRLKLWWEDNSYKVFKYATLSLAFIVAVGFIIDLIVELSMARHGRDRIAPPKPGGLPPTCKAVGSGIVDFQFQKANDFWLIHLPKPPVSGDHQSEVQNMGQIHILSAPEHQQEDVTVSMEYWYSSRAVSAEIEFRAQENTLSIFAAGSVQSYNDPVGYTPCLYLNVSVYVKPDLKQQKFSIGSSSLDVIFDANHTAMANEVVVQVLSGTVTSFPGKDGEVHWGGRDISIITDSGAITGVYPLYDSLHLETYAGSITSDLTLHPGRYGTESEALLTINSHAGAIRVDAPVLRRVEERIGNATIDDIPKRKYHTDVDGRAGMIDVTLPHGIRTSISGGAGAIAAALTPILEPYRESHIAVKSNSGGLDVTVKDCITYPNEPLRNLYGDYEFNTGHFSLRYPAEWEGSIIGRMMAGITNVDWPGMQITKREREGNGVYTRMEGKKGKGNGVIKFNGVSGSAELMGRGGKAYPNATDNDHRRVIDGDEDGRRNWPVVLPPFFKQLDE